MADEDVKDDTNTDTDDTLLTGTEESTEDGKPTEGDKSDETKASEEKSDDDKSDDKKDDDSGDGAPEAYTEFTLPEEVTLDAALLEAATPVFKDLNLTQEQAQKLIDFQAAQVQAAEVAQVESFNALKEDWVTQAKADKEFGGDAFDENVKLAGAAVNTFGTPEFKQLLNDYGIGNHPEMIRLMVKIGKLTKEDNPLNDGDSPINQTKDRAELLYPDAKSA